MRTPAQVDYEKAWQRVLRKWKILEGELFTARRPLYTYMKSVHYGHVADLQQVEDLLDAMMEVLQVEGA